MKCQICILLSLVAVGGRAQFVELRTPIAGVVFDSRAKALRPIIGVPGSAHVAAALPGEFEAAWVAPGGNRAIAISAGRTFLMEGLRGQLRPLQELNPEPSLVEWSSNGLVVALYAPSQRRIDVARAGEISVSVGSPLEEPATLGISNDGRVVWSSARSVAGLNDGSEWHLSGTTALRFCSNGKLYAANAEGVFALKEAGSVERIGQNGATALACSLRGDQLIAVSAGSTEAVIYDLAEGRSKTVMLDRPPTILLPLADPAMYLLEGVGQPGEAAIILDTTGEGRTLFVPAGEAQPL